MSKKRTVSEIMKTEKREEVLKKSKEISTWIESQLKEKLPKDDLRESLLDGVVLCKLINALAPGALKRYHKKPRMLAMKIENIGFFLATCKTRLNLPPALLFQPTDIHDDSNNLSSMSKVLNVLSFLKGDEEMIQELPDDEDEENAAAAAAAATAAKEASEVAAHEPEPEVEPEPEPEEPQPEPEPELEIEEPEPAPAPVVAPAAKKRLSSTAQTSAPTSTPTHASTAAPTHAPTHASTATPTHAPTHATTATPTAASTAAPTAAQNSSGTGEVQEDVLKAIHDVINTELSVDSKRKLLKLLQSQVAAIEERIMHSSDDQLLLLARECGVEDSGKGKGRDAWVDLIIKQGRVQ